MRLKYRKINSDRKFRAVAISIISVLFLGICVLSGLLISSAWFTDEVVKESDLKMGDISLNIQNGETETSKELPLTQLVLLKNQQIFDKDIVLHKSANGQPMFARIYLEFTGTGSAELNEAISKILESSNLESSKLEPSKDYKWEQIGPYFYLTNGSGTPLNILDATEYTFLQATALKMPTTAGDDLKVKFSAKAIQKENSNINTVENLIDKIGDETDLQNIKTITYSKSNASIQYGVNWVRNGGSIKFKPVANTGYIISSVSADYGTLSGVSADGSVDGSYTLSNITENTTITIETQLNNIIGDVTINGGNGKVKMTVGNEAHEFNSTGSYKFNPNASIKIEAIPNPGYELEFLNVNGESVSNNVHSFTNATAYGTVTVEVQFKLKTYTVNFSTNDASMGTITANILNGASINNGDTVNHNSTVVFTATPNEKFEIDNFIYSGENGQKDGNKFTVPDIQSNITVKVKFKKIGVLLNQIQKYPIQLIENNLTKNVSYKTDGQHPGKFKIAVDGEVCKPNYPDSGTAKEFYYFEDVDNPSNKYYLSGIDYGGKVWQNDHWEQIGSTEYWYDIPKNLDSFKVAVTYLTPNNFAGNKDNGAKADGDVVLGHFVTIIDNNAFYGCSGLTSITIPGSVTSINGYAFFQCSGLTSVNIPEGVISIGYDAFEYCKSLTSVTIGNGVTSIEDYAVSYCKSLTSITIPDSVTSIGNGAFNYCRSLTSITIPNSVTSIGYCAFGDCSNLTRIFCEAADRPVRWDSDWKGNCEANVYWKGQWHYENGVPTPNV